MLWRGTVWPYCCLRVLYWAYGSAHLQANSDGAELLPQQQHRAPWSEAGKLPFRIQEHGLRFKDYWFRTKQGSVSRQIITLEDSRWNSLLHFAWSADGELRCDLRHVVCRLHSLHSALWLPTVLWRWQSRNPLYGPKRSFRLRWWRMGQCKFRCQGSY